jgi:hypothetical protein
LLKRPHPTASSLFFSPMAQQPLVGHGLLIIEASRSHSDTPHSVGLLWKSDQPVEETYTWKHTKLTRDRHPCTRRDSNPQSQQASGRIPTPHLPYAKFYLLWFEASAAMLIRSALFWGIRQHRMVILCRRFGTTYRSHLQGSRSPRRVYSSWTSWPLNMGPICYPETSVKDYYSTLRYTHLGLLDPWIWCRYVVPKRR